MKKIKNVVDLEGTNYLIQLGIFVAFILGFTALYFLENGDIESSAASFFCGFLTIFFAGAMFDKKQSKAEAAYKIWLSGFGLNNLLELRVSVELDGHSRTVVTEYLNEHHESWSLG